jgi:hypothetical protein
MPEKGSKKKKNKPIPVQYEASPYEKYVGEKRKRNRERLKEICGDDCDILKRNSISIKVSILFNLFL